MNEYNFVYNGKSLNDLGLMVCYFDSVSGIETNEVPSITFNTVQNNFEDSFRPTYVSYENTLESNEIGICKANCFDNNIYFSRDEVREVYKWLDIKSFRKLTIENNDMFEDIYFLGGFTSINLVKHHGRVIGFKVKFTSQYPYGFSEDITYRKTITTSDNIMSILNDSDDVKPVHPTELKIKVNQSGNLTIKNSLDDTTLGIKNCIKNEIIVIDCISKIIETDNSSHDIFNDFNYNFLRLLKNDNNDVNKLTIDLPCDIEIIVNEPRKVGFI